MFYRPAKQEDFDRFLIDNESLLRHITEDVAKMVEYDFMKAFKELRDNSFLNRHDAWKICKLYQQYIHAKTDFNKGIKVYVSYK